MFRECNAFKVYKNATPTDNCSRAWRIPSSGAWTRATNDFDCTFGETIGDCSYTWPLDCTDTYVTLYTEDI